MLGLISFILFALASVDNVVSLSCLADERPNIKVNAERKKWSFSELSYGNDIILNCSSIKTGHLEMWCNGNLEKEELNANVIQLYRQQPDIGTYTFICSDADDCRDYLTVVIKPASSVDLPKKAYNTDSDLYFAARGDTVKFFCSGNNAPTFKIVDLNQLPFTKEIINETTVTTTLHIKSDGEPELIFLNCLNEHRDYSKPIILSIDYYPSARNFKCITYTPHKFSCSWISPLKSSFKLFLIGKYGTTLLCAGVQGSTERTCTSDDLEYTEFNGSLLLETCNEVYCDNQTFSFVRFSIFKYDPPSQLKLLNVSSHEAVISWRTYKGYVFTEYDFVFNVEYRMLAMPWQQVNASSVTCQHDTTCVFSLKLPCPDAHYEFRVRVKISEHEDRLWSDPASMYFFTKPDTALESLSSVCYAALEEPESIVSAESALSEIGKLIRYTIKEKAVLRKRINDLKEKLDNMKVLLKI